MRRASWRVREFYANSELPGKLPSRIAFVLCCEVQRGKFLRGIAQVQRKEYYKVAKRLGTDPVPANRAEHVDLCSVCHQCRGRTAHG